MMHSRFTFYPTAILLLSYQAILFHTVFSQKKSINLSKCLNVTNPTNSSIVVELNIFRDSVVLPRFYSTSGHSLCNSVLHADSVKVNSKCNNLDFHPHNDTEFAACDDAFPGRGAEYKKCVWNEGNVKESGTVYTNDADVGTKVRIELYDNPNCKNLLDWGIVEVVQGQDPATNDEEVENDTDLDDTMSEVNEDEDGIVEDGGGGIEYGEDIQITIADDKETTDVDNNNPMDDLNKLARCFHLIAMEGFTDKLKLFMFRDEEILPDLYSRSGICRGIVYADSVSVQGVCTKLSIHSHNYELHDKCFTEHERESTSFRKCYWNEYNLESIAIIDVVEIYHGMTAHIKFFDMVGCKNLLLEGDIAVM